MYDYEPIKETKYRVCTCPRPKGSSGTCQSWNWHGGHTSRRVRPRLGSLRARSPQASDMHRFRVGPVPSHLIHAVVLSPLVLSVDPIVSIPIVSSHLSSAIIISITEKMISHFRMTCQSFYDYAKVYLVQIQKQLVII